MNVATKTKTRLKTAQPKYFIHTFGCQMNVKDSQNMAGVLEALGFIETKNIKKSNVVIINTCSIRQAAEDKTYGFGLKFKDLEEAKKPLTFITGCMVGSAKGTRTRFGLKYLKDKMPWADYFLAPNEESTLPQILHKEGLVDDWAIKTLGNLDLEMMAKRDSNKTAFINISYGCDNFCTFCVVPYARGRELSRPKVEIINEINHAVMRGYSHITLLGQNVNSWMLTPTQKLKTRKKIGKHPFAELLREIHEIKGVEKISFITSNPWDFTPDLVETLKLPKIERFLHLPVQSGNNKVLKTMNRRHTIEEYLELINEIRAAVPNMVFGTDIIVGFPGETNEEFLDTVKLFEKVKFKVGYISIYSSRKGTPASEHMVDDVPLKVKKQRHKILYKVFEENKLR